MRRPRVSCRLCDLVLTFVTDRLGAEELRALRQHLRAAHPNVALPDDSSAGAALAWFEVEEVT